MKISEFDYWLPKELIAQQPAEPRDSSRLMVLDKKKKGIELDSFFNICKYLRKGDVLVLNDTKVFPARLLGMKDTGGKVEVLLVKLPNNEGEWEFMGRNIGRAKEVQFGKKLRGVITQSNKMVFNFKNEQLMRLIYTIGYMPLPPYIDPTGGMTEPNKRQRYQTVYARQLGSTAAPTAGLHFTTDLMDEIKRMGVVMEKVTLHVGLGTFGGLKFERVEENKLHKERYEIDKETGARIMRYKKQGKRIIAVGTTSVRTLESWALTGDLSGDTEMFIYPEYKFKIVDGLITNFHLPKSSLLILVSAFAGKDYVLKAYNKAVRERFRFFSFGDAMFIS